MSPPLGSKLFDRTQNNSEHKRIEPGPGWIIDPCLKAAERHAAVDRRILPSEKCAEQDSAEDDQAWKDDGRPRTEIEKEQKKRKPEIELILDREGPGM